MNRYRSYRETVAELLSAEGIDPCYAIELYYRTVIYGFIYGETVSSVAQTIIDEESERYWSSRY